MTKRQLQNKVPEVYHKLISDVWDSCKKNKVEVIISDTKLVNYLNDKSGCGGYFGSDPLQFAVAVGNPLDRWLAVFIHESCHLDQYLEDRYIWDTTDYHIQYLFNWIGGDCELSNERVVESMKQAILLERDCEERTVGKIKKYNLPIDISEYIQKANAYLYSYPIYVEKRKWFEGIYSNPKVWKKCPKHFISSYSKIPKGIKKEMELVFNALDAHKV